MKALLSFFFLLFVITTYAQTFEGTLAWSIKTEITDPKMKAKMEQAQKEMNNPANQAKMKQMQEQMNSPQMKAMLESNPQMKTQMQNAMKAMQGGDMSSMMPKSLHVKIKGKSSLTKMDGGIMAAEILALNDKNKMYLLDRESKTYSLVPSGKDETTSKSHKVTKTSETTRILNYPCTKYIVEVTEHGTTVNQIFWTTTEIKGLNAKDFFNQSLNRGGQSMYYEGLEGIPLKMELTTPQMIMVMEATELNSEKHPDSDFVIPGGFTETK
jgi:hypothetical protein